MSRKKTDVQTNASLDAMFLREIRDGYERCDDALKAKIDATCERLTAGRKPFPPDKLRSKRVVLSFNAAEYERLTAAVEPGAEFAAAVREFALKAADEIIRRRDRAE